MTASSVVPAEVGPGPRARGAAPPASPRIQSGTTDDDQHGTDMTALNPTQPEPQPGPPAGATAGASPDPAPVPVQPPAEDGLAPLVATDFTYSVVVPVYNSQAIVGTTVDRIVEEFQRLGLSYELILVNDGSGDRSWEVISGKAEQNPRVIALNLLRNYGQHNANLAGFREATGDYVITMDDDLQNPPDQIGILIDE